MVKVCLGTVVKASDCLPIVTMRDLPFACTIPLPTLLKIKLNVEHQTCKALGKHRYLKRQLGKKDVEHVVAHENLWGLQL